MVFSEMTAQHINMMRSNVLNLPLLIRTGLAMNLPKAAENDMGYDLRLTIFNKQCLS